MRRQDKAKEIGDILDKLYPETPIPLDHSSAYTLLVAVMLSAQTTDKKVNQVTPKLFKLAKVPEEMAVLDLETIRNTIKEIGLAPTKAKNLKKRISSYINTVKQTNRIKTLISLTSSMEFIKTHTELDSFILENNLIKDLKPRFNVRLMDDKSFPYLKIDLHNDWPRVSITRNLQNDGSRYFGPYTSPGSARKNLETINKIFKSLNNVEIILVDDDSPDGTFEKVKKINNPNLKVFQRKSRGLASAFLLGLINSSSEVVGWLDSNMGSLAERFPEMLSPVSYTHLRAHETLRYLVCRLLV